MNKPVTRSALEKMRRAAKQLARTSALPYTFQLPIEHWHAWLGDPTIADAILDRLMHNCRRFHLEGESRRTRGAAARAAGKQQKEKEDQKT